MTGGQQKQHWQKPALALYIHVPFCREKCHYCDFVSYPGQTTEVMQAYCQAIKQEMGLVAAKCRPGPAATVYLGGGTPTLLPARELEELLKATADCFGWLPGAEISLEANPGTVDAAKYRFLLGAGVNRLSLGVQAFDDNLLQGMGRIHRQEEIYLSYRLARQAGFHNINLDLIFGLPGQTLASWKTTLKEAIALQPEHIAAYSLQVEAGTPWGDLAVAGRLSLPGEELILAMYREAREKLALAGYTQYEISNFAQPGFRCRHNLHYWYNQPYIGVGAAAASFWGDCRWQNHTSISHYCAVLDAGNLPVAEKEKLTLRLQMAETMFMGLRLMEGINLRAFRERFGVDARAIYAPELRWLTRMGLVEMQAGHLKLTEKGLPLANEVFMQFI